MKGILFKPEMIKAIVEGRKTVTHRVMKPQPLTLIYRTVKGRPELEYWYEPDDGGNVLRTYDSRYQVGEVVYIKEAIFIGGIKPNEWAAYKLDVQHPENYEWHSPLFMPAWAARYFIKITNVRAERLQEITEEDCKAEGIDESVPWGFPDGYINSFGWLWDSINPKYPWGVNPWVWVYSFLIEEKY